MKFIGYTRVSTQKQGDSGLGLEAQRAAIQALVARHQGTLVAEFEEIESGRKGAASRPALMEALKACKKHKATLVIGKLDRISRDVRFFLEVLDDSGISIRFADLPDNNPNTAEGRMILISMVNFSEFEARKISDRTKAALAAAKARGVKLGVAGASNLKPNIEARQQAADNFAKKLEGVLEGFRAKGLTQRAQVNELNALGIKTAKGGEWSQMQLQRVLARLFPSLKIVQR